MTQSELIAALQHLRPDAAWTVNGTEESYTVEWLDDSPQPTDVECESAWKEIEQDVRLRPVRTERDRLLAASDWTQVADAPVDSAAWAKYRQALRDLPAKIKDPTGEVAWPEPPK